MRFTREQLGLDAADEVQPGLTVRQRRALRWLSGRPEHYTLGATDFYLREYYGVNAAKQADMMRRGLIEIVGDVPGGRWLRITDAGRAALAVGGAGEGDGADVR